jgi:hypothetical protein
VHGIFTISLDFELHWGGFEKWPLELQAASHKFLADDQSQYKKRITIKDQRSTSYNLYFLNTRQVIPQLLQLFARHEVHVTWATVGMLMHPNKETLVANFPSAKPTYVHDELSAYQYMHHTGIGENEVDDPFHYAHSLVTKNSSYAISRIRLAHLCALLLQ